MNIKIKAHIHYIALLPNGRTGTPL